MVITCVDVILQRKVDSKVLIFYRRDAPAANIFWLPGGRLFRGETFADAAKRKIRDECGIKDDSEVIPIGIIDCWNTLFPDSNWDNDRRAGCEGTQTCNITIFCKYIGNDNLDEKMDEQKKKEFAVESHKWISLKEGISSQYDKYVRLNFQKSIDKGYVSI